MSYQIQNLTSSLEDYIEEIYLGTKDNKTLKSAELARKLSVSRASVSEAINKLVKKELVNYSSYGSITLTEKGLIKAKNVYNRHSIIKNFLQLSLNIEEKEASETACKMEHIVTENILERMESFNLKNTNLKTLEEL